MSILAPVDSWVVGMRLALWERLRLPLTGTIWVDREVHILCRFHSLVVT